MAAEKTPDQPRDLLLCKLESMEGVLRIEEVLGVVFAGYLSSSVYTSSDPIIKQEAEQLYDDLNKIIDQTLTGQVGQGND